MAYRGKGTATSSSPTPEQNDGSFLESYIEVCVCDSATVVCTIVHQPLHANVAWPLLCQLWTCVAFAGTVLSQALLPDVLELALR